MSFRYYQSVVVGLGGFRGGSETCKLIYCFLLGAGLLFGLSGWLCWLELQDDRAGKLMLQKRQLEYEQDTLRQTVLAAKLGKWEDIMLNRSSPL